MTAAVRAVTVDLDDTLFPQADWLSGAWDAVALRAERLGVPADRLRRALDEVCAAGSDQGRIIDQALLRTGREPGPYLRELVTAFAAFQPARLDPFPGVRTSLLALRERVPVVVVTDGNPQIQRAKLAALRLEPLVEAVVISDELGGRAFRKPHPAPFERALALLGVPADSVVHIGDRPAKDVAGAAGVGMRCIRVRTGEYADEPDGPERPWTTVDTFPMAVEACLEAATPGARATVGREEFIGSVRGL